MNRILVLFLFLLILSCDDGNFDVPEFDFSSIDIQNCGDAVLFKINENETLVIQIDPKLNENEGTFLTHDWDEKTFSVTESGTNKITYRTLAEKPTKNYFCQNIPPTSPAVLSEWIGTGNVFVDTKLIKDDNDNVIEAEDESLNTDGDIFPNYIDSDDDGDDLATLNEDLDGDGDPTNDDTDGDGIKNYLDDDDDGDGTLTKDESTTEDANGDGIVDYLDPNTTSTISESRNFKNSYEDLYETKITILGLKLSNNNGNTINHDEYEYGTTEESNTLVEE